MNDITRKQIVKIIAICNQVSREKSVRDKILETFLGEPVASVKFLTKRQASAFIEWAQMPDGSINPSLWRMIDGQDVH